MQKILIVDDDADLREVMQTVLLKKYEVKEASGRTELQEVLKSYSPDLIILDVMMEEKDSGFKIARELKKNKKHKDAKILMLTSIDRETKTDFKSSAGDPDWLPVDDYCIKPIEPKMLLEKVANLLS